MRIDDGAGDGFSLKVNSNKRAHVHAVSEAEAIHRIDQGYGFNLNTGLISMSANGTLMYFKNNEDLDFVLEAIAIGSFEGVTHSDDPYLTVVANPTGGDLISDATAVDMNLNRNLGSPITLADSLAYKGKSAGTLTGGDDLGILQLTSGGRSFFTLNLILPKGSSVGVKLTLNASSGSANYYCAFIGYLNDDANKDS